MITSGSRWEIHYCLYSSPYPSLLFSRYLSLWIFIRKRVCQIVFPRSVLFAGCILGRKYHSRLGLDLSSELWDSKLFNQLFGNGAYILVRRYEDCTACNYRGSDNDLCRAADHFICGIYWEHSYFLHRSSWDWSSDALADFPKNIMANANANELIYYRDYHDQHLFNVLR